MHENQRNPKVRGPGVEAALALESSCQRSEHRLRRSAGLKHLLFCMYSVHELKVEIRE